MGQSITITYRSSTVNRRRNSNDSAHEAGPRPLFSYRTSCRPKRANDPDWSQIESAESSTVSSAVLAGVSRADARRKGGEPPGPRACTVLSSCHGVGRNTVTHCSPVRRLALPIHHQHQRRRTSRH